MGTANSSTVLLNFDPVTLMLLNDVYAAERRASIADEGELLRAARGIAQAQGIDKANEYLHAAQTGVASRTAFVMQLVREGLELRRAKHGAAGLAVNASLALNVNAPGRTLRDSGMRVQTELVKPALRGRRVERRTARKDRRKS